MESSEYTITVDRETAGERLDKALSLEIEEISRSYIQKLIEDGQVFVDDKKATSKKEKVKEGQRIRVTMPPVREAKALPEEMELDVVYEDKELLVVNKPKGLVVHPAAGNPTGTLVNGLLHHCGNELSSINGVMRPGIVHRIDKDTSGLLVVAKTDVAHKGLAEQLACHSIVRAYRAVVLDNIREDEGTVDEPIGRDPKNRLRQAVVYNNSKRAVTHYTVIERMGRYTLIEARLETGRTHQIRVHMAYIKHPLLGDALYGSRKNPFSIEGQMLHAYRLGFIHPVTSEYMEFRAEDPQEFDEVLKKIRGRM